MAVRSSKVIFLKILKKYTCNKFLLPVTQCKTFLPYSTSNVPSDSKKHEVNIAVQAFIKRNEEQAKFLQTKQKEYEDGKVYLAHMLGEKVEDMTQEKIDEAIQYLFPSALFVPSSRPMMKPAAVLYKKESPLPFDSKGKPFHHLFFTTIPNFCSILHEASVHLEKLQNERAEFNKSAEEPKPIVLQGTAWFTREELGNMCEEKIRAFDYNKFLEVFEALASHPLAYKCSDFILKYRKHFSHSVKDFAPTPEVLPDGTIKIFVERAMRKNAVASVTMTYPGTGVFKVNGRGIDYFTMTQSREQTFGHHEQMVASSLTYSF